MDGMGFLYDNTGNEILWAFLLDHEHLRQQMSMQVQFEQMQEQLRKEREESSRLQHQLMAQRHELETQVMVIERDPGECDVCC